MFVASIGRFRRRDKGGRHAGTAADAASLVNLFFIFPGHTGAACARSSDHPDTSILGAAAALLAASLACGLLVPPLFGLLLAAAVAAGIAFLALRFPTPFCVAWLLITA